MFPVVGIVVLILLVFGGFAMTGGNLGPVMHALPHEMLIIGGAAVGGGGRWIRVHAASIAPVIRPVTSSGELCAMALSATFVPRRSTTTRSATAKTSGMRDRKSVV